tara:strand:- start:321 stop:752 length:432 start_codon:yes stop_codon:yes gene_type:complete
MRIKILIIGKIKEIIFKKKINDYIKWINKDIPIELITLKNRKNKTLISNILNHLSSEKIFCCLSDEGTKFSSKKFSKFIFSKNKEIIFLIGGPEGYPEILKKKSNYIISLSNLTFPHEMAILILTEQIFRAVSIYKGSKYHRE